uniref:Reverse transcriptase domain-containing protein n=1 Tax=Tanacetum cinerariifolium TaxID=118510 RepID=A0A699IWA8_TANCI|nr:hypothetical protein [Tanacetum cinerariifolium]
MSEVYYNGQNSCYDSTSIGFDQSQPQQYTVDHPIFNAHNSYLDSQIQLNSTLAKIKDQMTTITSDSLDDNIISGFSPFSAITPDEPVLSTEEPDNSLSMRDEHLDTIPATKSDEFIKSGASPPDSELVSSEVMKIVILEETNTFDNSLPEFETFCFDVEEISSGSTTTHPDISLPEYEAFHDDHVKEFSSGSPTTPPDSSLYASFIFDLLINLFPPADRSDSYEFTDELIPFISAPEYDCFRFKPSSESLFAYVVWIFLPFLVYSVVPHYLLSLRDEDIIFDPGICKSTFFRPDISHRCAIVKKFNTHRSHLNKCPMLIHGQNNPILDVLLFHFYPP